MFGFHITAGKRWGYTSANDFLRNNMEGDQWDSSLFLTSWFMLCPIWQLRQCQCKFVDEDVLKLKGICGLLRGTKI